MLCNDSVHSHIHPGQPTQPCPTTEPSASSARCSSRGQLGPVWTGARRQLALKSPAPVLAETNIVHHVEVSGVRSRAPTEGSGETGGWGWGVGGTAEPVQHGSVQCKLKQEDSCALCWLQLTNMSGH